MFTKDDFSDYINELSILENKMMKNINELLDVFEDEEIISLLKKMKEDEINHREIIKDIFVLIEKV